MIYIHITKKLIMQGNGMHKSFPYASLVNKEKAIRLYAVKCLDNLVLGDIFKMAESIIDNSEPGTVLYLDARGLDKDCIVILDFMSEIFPVLQKDNQ